MKYLTLFIIYFVIIYLFYLFTVILRKKKYDKYKKSTQIVHFIKKYNLDFTKISFIKFINIIAFTNSFIMSSTLIVMEFIDKYVMKILVAFVVLFVLIFICYRLIGFYIERKNKNV